MVRKIFRYKKLLLVFGFLCLVIGVGVFFSIWPIQQYKISNELDVAVSLAIKNRNASLLDGECITEGHVILGAEEKNGAIITYNLASNSSFGFENGIFSRVRGSFAIPTTIKFSKNKQGEYSMIDYKEAFDGINNNSSIRNMFPIRLWDKVFNKSLYIQEIENQQEYQAESYLRSIGRIAKVSMKSQRAFSYFLFELRNKERDSLQNCPDWLGTRERIENGVRYIYETSEGKTGDGYDLIRFRKVQEKDGSLIEERKYKIVGNQSQLIGALIPSSIANVKDTACVAVSFYFLAANGTFRNNNVFLWKFWQGFSKKYTIGELYHLLFDIRIEILDYTLLKNNVFRED